MASSTQSALNLNLTLGVQAGNIDSSFQINDANAHWLALVQDATVIESTVSQVSQLARQLQTRSAEVQAKKNEIQNLKREVALLKELQLESHQKLQVKRSQVRELNQQVKYYKTELEPKLAELEREKVQSDEINQMLLDEIERLSRVSNKQLPAKSI